MIRRSVGGSFHTHAVEKLVSANRKIELAALTSLVSFLSNE